jgi:hypothetical protein
MRVIQLLRILLEVNRLLKKIVKCSSILILLMSLISCNDDPTSLGVNLLPEQDFINASTINSLDFNFEQKSFFYDTDSLSLANATKIFLGKNSNVKSTMLMKFYMFFPDSITDAINSDSLNLISATMAMEPIYTFGNENNYFDFTLHEVTDDWNSLEFGKNELEDLTYNSEDVSSNRVFEDSLITLDIDKTLVENWLKLSAEESQNENYGVYFNFDATSDKVLGFPAISSLYDSVLTRLILIVEKPGKFTDTLSVQVTSDVHVVERTMEISSDKSIFVQGGIPIRSNLFFDVSQIPENSIINKATIKLFVNENESNIGTIASDYIGALILDDYDSSLLNASYAPVNLHTDSLASNFSGEITHFVQEWIENGNNGMKLYLQSEAETLNKIAIYATENSDLALRPYLEIIYTSKN